MRNGSSPGPAKATTTPRKRKFSPDALRRMREAQQRRWAKARGEAESSAPSASKSAKKRRRLSAAGRKAIQEALRRRWAQKRAAAATLKPGHEVDCAEEDNQSGTDSRETCPQEEGRIEVGTAYDGAGKRVAENLPTGTRCRFPAPSAKTFWELSENRLGPGTTGADNDFTPHVSQGELNGFSRLLERRRFARCSLAFHRPDTM